MSLLNRKSSKKKKSQFVVSGTVVSVAAIVVVVAYIVMALIMGVGRISQGKVLARTTIGTLPVGEMTYEEATQALDTRVKEVFDKGIQVSFRGEQFTVEVILSDAGNPEIAYPLVSYDTQVTMKNLQEREAGYNPLERLIAYVFGQKIDPSATVDTERLKSVIEKELAQYETPAQDAKLVVKGDTITVEAEREGLAFPHDRIVASVSGQMATLTSPSVTAELERDVPDIELAEAQAKISMAQKVLAGAPYMIVHEDKKWALDKELVSTMLAVFRETSETVGSTDSRVLGTSDDIAIGLAPDELEEYLEMIVVKDINVEAQQGKFEMKNGRVVEFQPSRTGLKLDINESVQQINDNIVAGVSDPTALVVVESEPDITVGDVNTFGIKELVGRGTTNFKGSPKNRRFNINLAAQKLNGILIAPGETFSLVKALSPI